MNPADFYFQLCEGDDVTDEEVDGVSEEPYFLITPKAYFDKHHCLDDECGDDNVPLPEGFFSLEESTFEFDGDPQHGREELLIAGFIEKKMF